VSLARTTLEEPIIHSADGTPLHGRLWRGIEPHGVLVIAHGLGEHGGCYDHAAELLASQPGLVDVLAFDFRGHGRSPGGRGAVRRYDDLVDDLRAAVAWTAEHRPGRPVFVLGHSNGGQVALRMVLEDQPDLAGLVLSNPSLKLAVDVPTVKLWLGRLLRIVSPGTTLGGDLDSALLSRDPEFDARRRADDLRHSRVSAPLFFGMVEGGPKLLERAGEIQLPLLLILSGSDPIVDPQTARTFFERAASPDKTLRLDPDAVHEPFSDLGREQVVDDLAAWLRRHLADARIA
jgi:alpha-beta hydrolase superfamily lysophospholipase